MFPFIFLDLFFILLHSAKNLRHGQLVVCFKEKIKILVIHICFQEIKSTKAEKDFAANTNYIDCISQEMYWK